MSWKRLFKDAPPYDLKPTLMAAANARSVATEVVYRVGKGAYATPLLDAALRKARLSPAQAALATEICYGTLRVLPRLDAVIGKYARHSKAMDEFVQACLRTAVFQLLYMRLDAPHAVVNEAVTLVRTKRDARLGGFVNAVLRAIVAAESKQSSITTFEAPAWFNDVLVQSLGEVRAQAFMNRPLPPSLGLRVNTARISREDLLARLKDAQPQADIKVASLSPLGILVRGASDPRQLPGYHEGYFSVQEEGAQIMALLVDAKPGERVADACAGHGTKTTLLAQQVGPTGRVVALDRYANKLAHLQQEFVRLGLDAAKLSSIAVDLTVGTAGLDGQFDRVLIDLPCTGLGTVHRRPELLLRHAKDDPQRLQELQFAIAGHALQLAKPNGHIVLGVCSPTRAEGIELVERLQQAYPRLQPWQGSTEGANIGYDPDGLIRLGPWLTLDHDGPDGYQIMQWKLE